MSDGSYGPGYVFCVIVRAVMESERDEMERGKFRGTRVTFSFVEI